MGHANPGMSRCVTTAHSKRGFVLRQPPSPPVSPARCGGGQTRVDMCFSSATLAPGASPLVKVPCPTMASSLS